MNTQNPENSTTQLFASIPLQIAGVLAHSLQFFAPRDIANPVRTQRLMVSGKSAWQSPVGSAAVHRQKGTVPVRPEASAGGVDTY